MKCKECEFFKYDYEFDYYPEYHDESKGFGDCSRIFPKFIFIYHAETWRINHEFGCIYGEPKKLINESEKDANI